MPKPGRNLAVALLLLGSAVLRVPAAPPARFSIDVWGPDRGLRSSAVISLIQSQDGFLWLGTVKGLIRFDGVHFTPFNQDDASWLNNSRVVRLFEDSRRNLWIGTETDGAARIEDGHVVRLEIGQRSHRGRLGAACEDAAGSVWLGTADGNLSRYRNGKMETWSRHGEPLKIAAEKSGPLWLALGSVLHRIDPAAEFAPPQQIPGIPVVTNQNPLRAADLILASSRGGCWLLADGQVQKWTATGLAQNFGAYPWQTLTNQAIMAACEDREGNLVVGTSLQGVFWFNAAGKAAQISETNGLSNNYVLSLCVDREGSLWIGTDGGGLNRVTPQVFKVVEQSRQKVIQSVCEDARGGLWVGVSGGGVDYFKDGVFEQIGQTALATHLNVASVYVDHSQRTWVGVQAQPGYGLLLEVNARILQPIHALDHLIGEITAIHQDRSNRLWVGTREGLGCWDQQAWRIWTNQDGLSANNVQALAEDLEGDLWVGTRGGGLNRFRAGHFTVFHKEEPDGLPSDDISSLYVDEEGVLWIATPSKGLARFHHGKWTRYSSRDGLATDSLGYLIDDTQGNLWIGSDVGLMRVPKKALNAMAGKLTNSLPGSAYGKSDGLPTLECSQDSQPGPARSRDGTLWFPTTKGLASVNPADIHPNTNPPPVVIESVLIEGRDQNTNGLRGPVPGTITLHPGQGRLDIQFTSLNLAAPERGRVKYRLEGHEPDWTDAGNVRPGVAHYTRLPPGPYRFQVTACNEDGIWNETGAVLALVVEPPFWRTPGFITGSSLVFLGLIVGAVHYFSTQRLQRQLEGLRQQQALEKERQRIARDIHDQLGASLTQVSLLGELVESDKDLPNEVEAHAKQISQTARDTSRALDEIVWAVNPSNDTLDGLITYFCKYAQEYLTLAELRYRLDVPAELPATPIPPDVRHNVFLAAKEAVTNIVRHAKATSVWIRMRWQPGSFTLEIEDNGAGMAAMDEKRARSRNGLSNMRKRLEEVGGTCTFYPGAEGGTVVRLMAPLGKG